jgi:hypothetical protein
VTASRLLAGAGQAVHLPVAGAAADDRITSQHWPAGRLTHCDRTATYCYDLYRRLAGSPASGG